MLNRKIVVAGHMALDITPVFGEHRKNSLEELIKPGKMIRVGEAQFSTGGAVSNTGLALHKLGADVHLVGKVGKDRLGRILWNMIRKSGCSFDIATAEGERTSYTIVIAPKGLDRIFLHDSGCNDTFSSKDVDEMQLRDASHFHFGYPTLMKQFYQKNGEELVILFQKAKSFGLTTSLDLAAMDADSKAALCDWEEILSRVLPYVDFFVPSIEELGYMIKPDLYEKWQEKAGDEDIALHLSYKDDVAVLTERLMDMGAKVVLLKCGIAGMYLRTASESRMREDLPHLYGWDNIRIFEDSYRPEQILSAKGAGDSSIGAFLKAVLDGFSPEECLRYATATGAACVTQYDTISGLLSFEEIRKKIDRGWEKQKIMNP